MTTVAAFENAMRRELDAFMGERQKPVRMRPYRQARKPQVARQPCLVVKLAVREKRLAMDTEFTHVARTVSRLQAQIEAEQEARAAGWPIIGYVVSIEKEVARED